MDQFATASAATSFLLDAVKALGDNIWDNPLDAATDEAAEFGRLLLAKLLSRDRLSLIHI